MSLRRDSLWEDVLNVAFFRASLAGCFPFIGEARLFVGLPLNFVSSFSYESWYFYNKKIHIYVFPSFCVFF